MRIESTPIMMKEKYSFIFLEKCNIDIVDGSFATIDKTGIIKIPIAGISCIFLEPGTRITHAAISLAATVNCLIIWIADILPELKHRGFPLKGF
jgi:CRISPR-associated protein Cas1